ncbi:CK1/WORM6 protein kinase [Loa loa]|uniref:CK1/WORM6 protein kinase n=1 Tax=Loa loa TaxID=7209 RepID=A0A1S0UAG1_LOALO|nr:CK1/WORM6 protein kinase [Loa loa]EFO26813.1 CK1/WORM6 protein kinase [Loa loa]
MVEVNLNPEEDVKKIIYLHPGDVLGDWTVLDKIGEGGFGAVYLVKDNKGNEYAMKTESINATAKVLKAEYYVLTELKKAKATHFCDILDSGLVGENKYVVMTLVGQSLTDLRKHDPAQKIQKFTMGCALSVGMKCLEAIEELHNIGYLHRDIKPGNFAIGRKNVRQIYLLDFGMCRKYLNNQSYIRNPRRSAGFRGTVRYASISSHISREQCRKDDLESWIYDVHYFKSCFLILHHCYDNFLVELTVGYLPWKNMQDKDEVGRCKQLCRKDEYIKELFGGCPREYITIMRLIDSIRYYSKPEYSKITDLLRDALRNNNVLEYPYDWEKYLEPSRNTEGTESKVL